MAIITGSHQMGQIGNFKGMEIPKRKLNDGMNKGGKEGKEGTESVVNEARRDRLNYNYKQNNKIPQ